MDAARSNPWPMAWSFTGISSAAMVLGVVYIGFAVQPERVSAPKSFSAFKAKDGSFSCMAPDGWNKASGEMMGIAGRARFRKGEAEVDITSDLAGSLMADIAKATGAGMPDLSGVPGASGLATAAKKPPVDMLHEAGKEAIEDEMSGYEEQAAKPFQSQLGEARFSEFTADGRMFAGKVHGYRATILGNDRSFTVICQCGEPDWPGLKPAFEKVILSLTAGGG